MNTEGHDSDAGLSTRVLPAVFYLYPCSSVFFRVSLFLSVPFRVLPCLLQRPAFLEQIPHLDLKHPRRIDVREARESVGGDPRAHDLTEGRIGCPGVAIHGLCAPEDIAVIEQVEAFQPQEQRPLLKLQTSLDEDRHVFGPRSAESRLADDAPVDDGTVV